MPRRCSPGTRLYGLIGSPVKHSLSPLIHCTFYERYGVDAVYLVWDTVPEALAERVHALRSLAAGFNATIPLKEKIIGLLDGLEEDAAEIGAVNTVKNGGGKLWGYNTDYLGVMKCLGRIQGERALVIGAGGAARAAVYALYRLGVSRIIVANRSMDRAKKLAHWARGLGIDLEISSLDDAENAARRADIIVNATPLGSKSCCPDQAPPVIAAIHSGQVVFDMVYQPLETLLLREARKRGARTVTGLCMLVWQALYAEKIWLGIEPSIDDYNYVVNEVVKYLSTSG
ncbi:shikimate dehydrogenase [Pyrofollis japonicus]|uniref:shikimate dehydrogenase n=1 Tax=Pyrofollis japonicus TaxID=3060460 RepID=UPI00295AD7CF|nr:shikimate dehydrogenase [Pyrofollis japonicus]BEP17825.1 shikimate dehydrogenase [Pyrofollis japonicus]